MESHGPNSRRWIASRAIMISMLRRREKNCLTWNDESPGGFFGATGISRCGKLLCRFQSAQRNFEIRKIWIDRKVEPTSPNKRDNMQKKVAPRELRSALTMFGYWRSTRKCWRSGKGILDSTISMRNSI